MEVTGKCKTDFEKWLQEQPLAPYPSMVWDIPLVVRNAFIVSFFDAAEIITTIEYLEHLQQWSGKVKDYISKKRVDLNLHTSREKALEEAIITANIIYNERN